MKKTILKCIVGFFALLIIALIVYNCIFNCDTFFKVNAINCISAFIVVGISFFIVQRQTDYRKQKDIFINLLETLKILADDSKSYNFTNVEKEEMLMRTRDIALKIDIIKRYNKKFDIVDDVAFIEDKFKEYQTVIDNYSTDMDLLSKLHKELKRPLNLISQKVFEIMLNLYD